MKNCYLAFRILKKQKILNLILCIELAITLVFLSYMFNRASHNSQIVRIVDKGNMSKSINYTGRFSQVFENEGELEVITDNNELKELKKYLDTLDVVDGISSIDNEFIKSGENEYKSFVTYDSITAEKVKLPLKKGTWFSDKELKEGIIPVVVVDSTKRANTYKVGEQFSGKMLVKEEVKNSVEQELTFEVVGIVNRECAYVFEPSGVRNYTETLEYLFEKVDDEEPVFLCQTLRQHNFEDREESNCLIYLDETVDEEKQQKIVNEILQYGYCDKVSDMTDKSMEIVTSKLVSDFPNFFSMLCIAAIGIISITFLNSKKQRKEFSIYKLCGCSSMRTILIYFIYFACLLSVSFILYVIYMRYNYKMDVRDMSYMYVISRFNLLVAGAICLVISIVSTLIPFLKMRKSSVMSEYNLQ